MSGLRARAEEYLAMRRALGFKLTSHGSRLMSFIRFCEDRGATVVTTDLAVEWSTSTPSDHEAYQARPPAVPLIQDLSHRRRQQSAERSCRGNDTQHGAPHR